MAHRVFMSSTVFVSLSGGGGPDDAGRRQLTTVDWIDIFIATELRERDAWWTALAWWLRQSYRLTGGVTTASPHEHQTD